MTETAPVSQTLLESLKKAREAFPEDKEEMTRLVNLLVANGTYPAPTPYMVRQGVSHLRMVESWGVDWHIWREPLACPHCGADLRDHDNGPPFLRVMGIEIPGKYDGILYWQCPDCHQNFPRFEGVEIPT